MNKNLETAIAIVALVTVECIILAMLNGTYSEMFLAGLITLFSAVPNRKTK